MMLQVKNLTKQYGPNYAVKNLNFSIAKGNIVGLIGKNGAGKTTTLRMLTGILNPTSGTASIDGFDIIKQPNEIRARIGFLPDSPPLYTDMTVMSFLNFVAGSKRVPPDSIQNQVEKVMKLTNISDHRHQIVSKLSHGYKQRVALAQTLVNDPPLLILDEPSSRLDPIQAREFRELIISLRDKHTILYSSHNLTEVVHSCDRVLIIDNGGLVGEYTHKQMTEKLESIQEIELVLHGESQKIKELLEKEGKLLSFHSLLSGNQLIRARVGNIDSKKPVEDVCNHLWKQGIHILSFELPETTLEQYFINHIQQGGAS